MKTDKVKWQMFKDLSYYDMWAIRPVKDHDYNSPRLFHFAEEADAAEFFRLIQKSYCAVLR
jgi:hypothetical protein